MADLPVQDLRRNYQTGSLLEADAPAAPLPLFRTWFDAALKSGTPEPNAMTLATVDSRGRPRARTVLLKGIEDSGLVFYTNYDSEKGHELSRAPACSLCFWWPTLERQVRVCGLVERISAAESDAYFASRPRPSKLGAIASDQSRVVPNREALERRFAAVDAEYAHREIPRPPHWGGYRVRPDEFEFWQGRANRMHDRLRYRLLDGRGNWSRERLSP